MKDIQELFSREMSRKEFLGLLGVALLSIIGINNFIASLRTNLRGQSSSTPTSDTKSGRGFGSSKFGA